MRTVYPPQSYSGLQRWMDRVEDRRGMRFAYVVIEPSMVPLIALVDDDGLLFARISPRVAARCMVGVFADFMRLDDTFLPVVRADASLEAA